MYRDKEKHNSTINKRILYSNSCKSKKKIATDGEKPASIIILTTGVRALLDYMSHLTSRQTYYCNNPMRTFIYGRRIID